MTMVTNDMKLKMFQEMLEAELEFRYNAEQADEMKEQGKCELADKLEDGAEAWYQKGQGVWNCMRILGIDNEYVKWSYGKNNIWAARRGQYNEL